MRIPRWLLVVLIAVSALALLAFPAWLWIEMPRWTAANFAAAIEARDVDRANGLLVDGSMRKTRSSSALNVGPNTPDFHARKPCCLIEQCATCYEASSL
jgi:hypothetical protein